jgi:hypothetical protein
VLVERRLTRRGSASRMQPSATSTARKADAREIPVQDFAKLEALLAKALQRAPSPSIAAGDTEGKPAPGDREPPRRRAPLLAPRVVARRSEPPLSARGVPPEPKLPSVEETESVLPIRAQQAGLAAHLHRLEEPPQFAAKPRANRPLVARAMGLAATVFSLVALVAVSALLVLLAVGSEPPAPVAEESAAAANAPDAPLPAEPVGPAVVTGSIDTKRDASRIPAQESAAPRFGTVRAAVAQDAPAMSPQAQETPAAENVLAGSAAPAPRALDAQSVFAPPVGAHHAASGQGSTGQGFAPMNADTASSAVAPANAAPETVASIAEPAAPTRSAPVTTHVNMRAGPDNDAAVVVVVPEGRNVDVVECNQWCEVIYDGRQGFIHRKFVTGAGG